MKFKEDRQLNITRRVHDIWALLGFIALFLFLYRGYFSKISQTTLNLIKIIEYLKIYFLAFSIAFTSCAIFLTLYSTSIRFTTFTSFVIIPIFTIHLIIYHYKGVPSIFKKRLYFLLFSHCVCIFIAIVLTIIYIFYIRKSLYFLKGLFNLTFQIYKNDIRQLVLLSLVFSAKIFLILAVTNEMNSFCEKKSKIETLFLYLFDIWSLSALIYTVRVYVLSLTRDKMEYNCSYGKSADDIFLYSGSIYFAGLLTPIRMISTIIYCYDVGPEDKFFIRYLASVFNLIYKVNDVLTSGFGKYKSKFAIHSAFVSNISYMKGAKNSNEMMKNEEISKLASKNLIWISCIPLYLILTYSSNLLLLRLQVLESSNSIPFYTFFALYIVFFEFLYSSCNANIFLFSNDHSLVMHRNKKLFSLLVNHDNYYKTFDASQNPAIQYNSDHNLVINISESPAVPIEVGKM